MKTIVAGVLICCAAAPCSLPAQSAFFRKDVLFGGPCGVTLGDFNGDQRPDMVVGTSLKDYGTPDGLFVLLNEGAGSFAQPVLIDPNPSCGTAIADFNGDGKLDLLTADSSILIGRGDGTFLPARRIGDAVSTALGDFNGDGKPDVVLGTFEGTIDVVLGNGDGTFENGDAPAGQTFGRPAVADLNRDGKEDLVLPTGASPDEAISVFLSNGDGTFRDPVHTSTASFPPLLADFNGDGLPDLLTAFDILLGRGDGSFGPPLRYVSDELAAWAGYPLPQTIADFDGDGHADVVVAWTDDVVFHAGWTFISVFPGNGDGTMKPRADYTVGDFPGYSTAGDLDGDGRPDLAVSSWTSNTVSLLLSQVAGDRALSRAVSAASGIVPAAPGSLATLYAPFPVTSSAQAASLPWPTSLNGVRLEVRDSSGSIALAPLIYSSPTQINFQVPEASAVGEATLALVTDAGSTPVGTMQIEPAAPGLFLLSRLNRVPAALAVAIEPSGARTHLSLYDPPTCDFPVESSCSPLRIPVGDDRPIYLSLFGTGFRGATTDNVEVSINGLRLPVQFAGPQATPGVDQINVRVLPELAAQIPGFGFGILVVTVDGVATNRAFLIFQ